MSDQTSAFIATMSTEPARERRAAAAKLTESGLFDFDRQTRRIVWVVALSLLALALAGAITLIAVSYGVLLTTTSTTGENTVTTTTRPDMSAAWAAVSAVIAGVVGLLVPSPQK